MTQPFDRTDEVEFLRRMPKTIDRATVLRVGAFTPGEPGHYASAWVLCIWPGTNEFGVHRAYYADDRPGSEYEWTVGSSTYVPDYDHARKLLSSHD